MMLRYKGIFFCLIFLFGTFEVYALQRGYDGNFCGKSFCICRICWHVEDYYGIIVPCNKCGEYWVAAFEYKAKEGVWRQIVGRDDGRYNPFKSRYFFICWNCQLCFFPYEQVCDCLMNRVWGFRPTHKKNKKDRFIRESEDRLS